MGININKILLFSAGDPFSASTWSNIPYCMARALQRMGIEVVGVNLDCRWLAAIYDCLIRRIIKVLLFPFHLAPNYYGNTRLACNIGNRIVKKTICRNRDAEACLFINYLFYNKDGNIPSVLISDWPHSYEIKKWGRRPNVMDRRVMKQEAEAINHAEHVVSIFEIRAKEMKSEFPQANIDFLGGNVINDLYPNTDKLTDAELRNVILKRKSESHTILFIGKPDRYKESARLLACAIGKLWEQGYNYTLDIVGMSANHMGEHVDHVQCHGFLHKDNPRECKKYYDLLMNAKVIVNPTPGWAAYSSIVEAMYYYTPVVIFPFDQFVNEFGQEVGFGVYNKTFTDDSLASSIIKVLSNSRYQDLCLAAHDEVKDYTWDNYVEKLVNLIESK